MKDALHILLEILPVTIFLAAAHLDHGYWDEGMPIHLHVCAQYAQVPPNGHSLGSRWHSVVSVLSFRNRQLHVESNGEVSAIDFQSAVHSHRMKRD